LLLISWNLFCVKYKFLSHFSLEEECLDDGFSLKPKDLHCWLTRVMYNRRSKFDPFWNNFVVGGLQDDKP
jgi:20S proteasome subunit beta 7